MDSAFFGLKMDKLIDAITLIALMKYHSRGTTNSDISYDSIGNIGGAIDRLAIRIVNRVNEK